MKLVLKHVENEILSPGDIFWKKNNGTDVLISKKSDILNFEMIEKLIKNERDLVLIDSIDFSFHDSMISLYEKYSEEFSMKDKIQLRNMIIKNLREEYVQRKKTQFEFNRMAWCFFSQLNKSEMVAYVKKDKELFERNISIASSYTFCAFLIGYYETKFLSNLFSSTLTNLMNLGKNLQILELKEKIESLRMQDSFSLEDCEVAKEIALQAMTRETMIFERYDGSGMREINSREMNDLEIILVAINHKFGFENAEDVNIFSEINSGNFDCPIGVLRMLQRILYIEPVSVIEVKG